MRLFPKQVGRTASKSPPWTSSFIIHRNLLFFSQASAKSFIDNGANCLLYYSLKRGSLRHFAYVVSDFSERKVKISPLKSPKANYYLSFITLFWHEELRGVNKNPNRANQRPRSWANGSFQNRGVCPQACPSPLLPSHHHFFALALFSRGQKKSSLLTRWKRLLCRLNITVSFG